VTHVGALRVVVLAEGVAETGGQITLPPSPGTVLWDDVLGPAHFLVRRILESLTPAHVNFLQPLRFRGRLARGSDLHTKKSLRQLLTWLPPATPPDLAIVLVDRDGDVDRRRTLASYTQGLALTPAIGIAVEAFEAWLLSDSSAIADVLEGATSPANPAALDARSVKKCLNDLVPGAMRHEKHLSLVAKMRLDLAPSLIDLRNELAARIAAVLGS
jgi:hypothetical protein